MPAWSSTLRAADCDNRASSTVRLASASRLASVDCSCTSVLLSSGLSITASTWPRVTASPATTRSATVPPAIAYSVGLLAAIRRPSADRSRTRSPRVTSAMRRREASTELPPDDQPCTSQPSTATPASAARPTASQRRGARDDGAATRWSWPEVSPMRMRWSMGADASGDGVLHASGVPSASA